MTLLLALFAMITAPSAAEKDAAQVDNEVATAMKVMVRRVGTWDEELTIKPGAWSPDGANIKATQVAKLSHNGRFLEVQGEGTRRESGDTFKESVLWIMIYEPQRKEFLTWSFYAISDGKNGDFWGGSDRPMVSRWDGKTQTWNYESVDKDRGIKYSGWTRWIDEDHIESASLIEDLKGNVLREQTGKYTRRKEM